MLKEKFIGLSAKYTGNINAVNALWSEIERNYSAPERYYHTLQHLEHLWGQLEEINAALQNKEAVLFSLYYHDIIYDSLKSDNEERSMEIAGERMKQISVPDETIRLCKAQIMATKSHVKSINSDTNYFTDADLSILGQDWEVYSQYYKDVRKEYSVYPDLVYSPGRKKVLNHFLAMERIFKTDHFYNKFEAQAKQNLYKELELL